MSLKLFSVGELWPGEPGERALPTEAQRGLRRGRRGRIPARRFGGGRYTGPQPAPFLSTKFITHPWRDHYTVQNDRSDVSYCKKRL